MKTIRLLSAMLILPLTFWAFVNPSNNTSEISADFQKFLDYFPQKSLPFALELGDLLPDDLNQQKETGKSLTATEHTGEKKVVLKKMRTHRDSEEYRTKAALMAEYLPDASTRRFSRMGPPEIIPVGAFALNENQIAIIYSTEHRFIVHSNNYKLAVFSKKGKLLSERHIAYYDISEVTTCQINRAGIIEQRKYSNEWEKDVEEFGAIDNQLLACNEESVQFFKITPAGTIETLKDHDTNERASTH